MFKSIFTKYITTFMLIIIISFSLLTVIMCTIVANYSDEMQERQLVRAAEVLTDTLKNKYAESGYSTFSQYLRYRYESIGIDISILTKFSGEIFTMIADTSGNIIAADSSVPEEYRTGKLSKAWLDRLFEEGSIQGKTNLDGLLPIEHLVYADIIENRSGGPAGVLITCSAVQSTEIVDVVLKTMIMAGLWVMLAAMIAVYFISDKIISPLKKMSTAAKSFAAGQLDVRVPVSGNDEITELATAFNNMADSLASLEEMRRSFVANVSHDLRSPMTSIAGFIDGMLDGAIPPEQHEHYLEVIATEVRRLSRLVASLLDISRIQAGDRKFTMTAFDICEMARLILISFEQKIDDKKLNVEFNVDDEYEKIFVYADYDAIYQVLYNICDNAVKFSREGGLYRISIKCREKKVFVSVYNEGEGIPAEDLPFVFDRFYKSDKSRGLDKRGVGLGMYISKTIMDAHHEEIMVNSVSGEFCEFKFSLSRTHEPIAAEQV